MPTTATTATTDLIAAVREHATAHYADGKGWDYIVEAWDDEQVTAAIGRATTARGAIANVKRALAPLASRDAEERAAATATEEPAVPDTTDTPARAPRQSRDPDAVALALAARDLARSAGKKSAYTSGEAREIINRFNVDSQRGVLMIRKDGTAELHRVKVAAARKYVAGEGKDDPDVKAAKALMAELSKDAKTWIYGRKLACFLLAAAA